jgi:HPt (histidine-containing phosphotransfer) domain-containing protein
MNPEVLDPGALAQLREVDEDGSLVAEVIETFLSDAPKQIEAIERGVATGDSKLLDRAAHTLKATSATVGAMILSAICKELESLGRAGDTAAAGASLPRMQEAYAAAGSALKVELDKLK